MCGRVCAFFLPGDMIPLMYMACVLYKQTGNWRMCICNISAKHALHNSAVTIKYQNSKPGRAHVNLWTCWIYMYTSTLSMCRCTCIHTIHTTHKPLQVWVSLEGGAFIPLCKVVTNNNVCKFEYLVGVDMEILTAPWPLQENFPRYTDSECDH